MKKFTLKAAFMYVLLTGAGLIFLKTVPLLGKRELQWSDFLGVLLICSAVFILWINHYTNVLTRLNVLVQGFAKGDLNKIEEVNYGDDEIGQLGNSLHLMAAKLNIAMQKMQQERDQMKTILASMVEGVLAFDTTGRLLLINKTAEEMLAVTWEKVEERYFLEILPNYQMAYLLNRCLDSGEGQMAEVRLSPVDNEYYRVYITPIKGKEKNFQGAIMVLRNITKLRQLEQMRSEFIANVSHELRTPLTSIKGYVETLLDGAMEDQEYVKKFLTIINAETNRLNYLISDLLFLSQLETGDMQIVKKEINSAALLEKVINLLQPMADNKRITMISEVVPGAETFSACPELIEQVLINLLDNAIKYSYEGGTVKIIIEPGVGSNSGEEKVLLKVVDQGPGIPTKNLSRLFERFYRVDKARSRQIGGTGLGLSIVKHVVERHHGRVQVESSEKKGTVFTVLLPKI